MNRSFRQPEILQVARAEGRVTVEALAGRFGVSEQTIRRDLGGLADAGALDRVHGGAVLPSGIANLGYAERRGLNAAAKEAIGRAAAALVPEGASLFLNIGTTTEAVARALLARRGLLVVTNNLNAASILAANPDCRIVLTGGDLRRADGGLTGPETLATVARYRPDLALLGCSGLDQSGDFLDFDNAEVAVSQAMIAAARRAYLVADATKFRRPAPVRVGGLAEMDGLVTDSAPPASLAGRLAGWNTAVILPAR